jgi:transcriptional regulator with XRE-family HTH domain
MTQRPRPPKPQGPPSTSPAPSVFKLQLGRALQQHRLLAGLTQAELAEYADLSLKYVGEVERGEANPSLDVLERLAAGTNWELMKTLEGGGTPHGGRESMADRTGPGTDSETPAGRQMASGPRSTIALIGCEGCHPDRRASFCSTREPRQVRSRAEAAPSRPAS